jgi:hypothetical protein
VTELHPAPEKQPREQPLPLVVEILPGQAGEGLLAIFEPGTYEAKPLFDLCQQMLARRDWSIEERQVLEDIQKQLQGGKLLAKGRDTQSPALDYARLEQSEAGESYFYVPVRAIKPQEGGAPVLRLGPAPGGFLGRGCWQTLIGSGNVAVAGL